MLASFLWPAKKVEFFLRCTRGGREERRKFMVILMLSKHSPIRPRIVSSSWRHIFHRQYPYPYMWNLWVISISLSVVPWFCWRRAQHSTRHRTQAALPDILRDIDCARYRSLLLWGPCWVVACQFVYFLKEEEDDKMRLRSELMTITFSTKVSSAKKSQQDRKSRKGINSKRKLM